MKFFKKRKTVKQRIFIVAVALIFILGLIKFGFETMTVVKKFFKEDEPSTINYTKYENCIIIK